MSEFGRINNRNLSPNPSYPNSRRSSNEPDQTTINYGILNINRRVSGGNEIFRTRSPSDPQNFVDVGGYSGGVGGRRMSGPSGYSYGNNYVDNYYPPSLLHQERKTYSSLNHLPEVKNYLQFMEDSTPIPQRSKSFNGRNSSRRSSFNRRRPRSRPRTPLGVEGDIEGGGSSCAGGLRRVGSGSSSHYGSSTSSYGNYLSPKCKTYDSSSYDNDKGNEADVEDNEPNNTNKIILERRSSIKTTFI